MTASRAMRFPWMSDRMAIRTWVLVSVGAHPSHAVAPVRFLHVDAGRPYPRCRRALRGGVGIPALALFVVAGAGGPVLLRPLALRAPGERRRVPDRGPAATPDLPNALSDRHGGDPRDPTRAANR